MFSAYIYDAVSPVMYEKATAYVKTSALVASLLAGVLGDLVTLTVLVSLLRCRCLDSLQVFTSSL